MRVLITGGAGVIGKELVKLMMNSNYTIMVADLKARPNEFGERIIYRRGDLNTLTLSELINFSPDLIFHLAATFERLEETELHFNENFDDNIKLSHSLILLSSKLKHKVKFIFASSYLIYDSSSYLSKNIVNPSSLSEENDIRPRNLTGLSKYYTERELEFTNRVVNNDFTYISARIFRVFGKESKDVVSRWIKSAIIGERIEVYNESNKFDYISSESCAVSLLALSQSDYQGEVNVGSGYPNSIEKLLSILVSRFPNLNIDYTKVDSLREYSFSNNLIHDKITRKIKVNRFKKDVNNLIDYYLSKESTSRVISKGNILVTSISNKVSIINNIREQISHFDFKPRLIGMDSDHNVLSKYFVDNFIKIPKYEFLIFENLIDLLKEHKIRYIIPTSDRDLVYFSQIKYALQEMDIFVMVSNKASIDYTGNKFEFYQRFKDYGNLIVTYTKEDVINLEIDRYVIKEMTGAGSVGVLLNLDIEEINKVINRFKDPVIQRMIKGTELSIDLYVGYDNRVIHHVVRERVIVVNGEAYYTRIYNDKIDIPKIMSFVQRLNLYGQVNLQMIIEDVTGTEYILEVNPRIGGASSLSTLNGLYSVEWFIKESNGVKFSIQDNQMNRPNAMRKYTCDYYEF